MRNNYPYPPDNVFCHCLQAQEESARRGAVMQCPEQWEECRQTYRSTVSQGESAPHFPVRRHTNTRVETRKRGRRMKCEGNVLWKRALRPPFQNQIPPLLIREFQTRTWHQQSVKCSSDLWMILVQKLEQVCRSSCLCFSLSLSADSEAVAVLTVWRENIIHNTTIFYLHLDFFSTESVKF